MTVARIGFAYNPTMDAAVEQLTSIIEPAMMNCGVILPEPGYHEALRDITRRTGTLLLIDETHTLCAGPGAETPDT